jgi:hypothetical protein
LKKKKFRRHRNSSSPDEPDLRCRPDWVARPGIPPIRRTLPPVGARVSRICRVGRSLSAFIQQNQVRPRRRLSSCKARVLVRRYNTSASRRGRADSQQRRASVSSAAFRARAAAGRPARANLDTAPRGGIHDRRRGSRAPSTLIAVDGMMIARKVTGSEQTLPRPGTLGSRGRRAAPDNGARSSDRRGGCQMSRRLRYGHRTAPRRAPAGGPAPRITGVQSIWVFLNRNTGQRKVPRTSGDNGRNR